MQPFIIMANNPNSAAAVDVPLSLCGCKLIDTQSLFLIVLLNHSIWSAYLFGVVISTVDGKFIIILFSDVGCHLPGEIPHLWEPLFQHGEGFLFFLSGIQRVNAVQRGFNGSCLFG